MLVYAFCTFELLSCITAFYMVSKLNYYGSFFVLLVYCLLCTQRQKLIASSIIIALLLHVASHAFGVCDGVNIVKLCVSCSGDQLDAIH